MLVSQITELISIHTSLIMYHSRQEADQNWGVLKICIVFRETYKADWQLFIVSYCKLYTEQKKGINKPSWCKGGHNLPQPKPRLD